MSALHCGLSTHDVIGVQQLKRAHSLQRAEPKTKDVAMGHMDASPSLASLGASSEASPSPSRLVLVGVVLELQAAAITRMNVNAARMAKART